MSVVSLIDCKSYDTSLLLDRVTQLFDQYGGVEGFVHKGDRVYIKPNMVEAADPLRGTITHPELVYAVAKLCTMAGGIVSIGDCPGGAHSDADIIRMYKKVGYTEAAQRAGARMVVNTTKVKRTMCEPVTISSYETTQEYLDADVFINIAKLKTHTLTGFTGAVKNLYGTIHGLVKVAYHSQFPNVNTFCDFLIDIANTVKPSFNIIDAVIGHEGEGPTSGTPKKVGYLLAAADIFALDFAAAKVMGLPLESAPVLQKAIERGLLLPAQISYPLLDPAEINAPKYKKADSMGIVMNYVCKALPSKVRVKMKLRPLPDKAKCIGCGKCIMTCPADAMALNEEGKISIDYTHCQACFCCQELCPQKAIKSGRCFLGLTLRQ